MAGKTNPCTLAACRLSQGLAALTAVLAAAGLWAPGTYARETPLWAAQGMGQDAVDLFFVAPLLGFSAWKAGKGGGKHLFLLAGILVYLAYSFVLYSFCVHFNRLFLLYCASLGLSVYGLALLAAGLRAERAEEWFERGKSTAVPALYLLATAAFFYFLWLSQDLPAVWNGTVPKDLAAAGLVTNPVHVLDLSIVLPAMAVAGVQLLRKRPSGYLLFPVLMVFSIVMALAIAGMSEAMRLQGLSDDPVPAAVFGVLAVLDAWMLTLFLRSLRNPEPGLEKAGYKGRRT